ncbi:hypothetical protein JR316_0011455 [Psilocybe cubensis]|uniref:Uncharacterized protein n=2 Tax=Psilocybe cubensis TaxID=181762 RepID=A0A8H7XWX8_PSICU|nr:hypothetical protein JR316_0011455 [Psilocybe cubensis]KAH9475894.1 hypothetical protein JR316_0011455 [Psilocybe cubensis]
MDSGTSPSGPDSESSSVYPVQRHAGKVGYGPNFASGAGLVDRLTGLATEIKGKATHNPAMVHHGHEIFTGEAKRKKILGIDDPDPAFDTGRDSKKKSSGPTTSNPPTGTVASGADPNAPNAPSSASVTRSSKEHVPEAINLAGPEHVSDMGSSVEHLKHS